MRAQKEVPKRKRKLRKPVIFILILIPILIVSGIYFSHAQKPTTVYKSKYHTGEIYKANHSANLLDYISTNSNIVISPYNINMSINGLYNLSENNEIKEYFNMTLEEANELYKKNKESLTIVTTKEDDFEKLYLSYVNELTKYNQYTINDISKLSSNDKQNLILLLRKVKLCINAINKIEESSLKFIKQYASIFILLISLSDKSLYLPSFALLAFAIDSSVK